MKVCFDTKLTSGTSELKSIPFFSFIVIHSLKKSEQLLKLIFSGFGIPLDQVLRGGKSKI